MNKKVVTFEDKELAQAVRRAQAALLAPTPRALAKLRELFGSDHPFYVVEGRGDSVVVDFGGDQGLTSERARVLAEFLLRKVQSGCRAVCCAGGRLRGVITSNLT